MIRKQSVKAKAADSIPPDSILVSDHSITVEPPVVSVTVSFKKQVAPYCFTTEQEVTLDDARRLCDLEGRGFRLISKSQLPIVEEHIVRELAQSGEELLGWYDEMLDAGVYWQLKSVNSRDAAMLLCGLNPSEKNPDRDALIATADRTEPGSEPHPDNFDRITGDNFHRLLLVFGDEERKQEIAEPRTLIQWRVIAADRGLKTHSWVDKYDQAMRCRNTSDKRGIGKQGILAVDWPLVGSFNQSSLKRALGDVPDWMKDARVLKGARGKGNASSTWNPAVLAACLLEKHYAYEKQLGKTIADHFPEWQDEWEQAR